jgi:hypothetical protein
MKVRKPRKKDKIGRVKLADREMTASDRQAKQENGFHSQSWIQDDSQVLEKGVKGMDMDRGRETNGLKGGGYSDVG